MRNTLQKSYLYSYKPEGHILNAHENEYMDEYDFDYEDELDDEHYETDDILDDKH